MGYRKHKYRAIRTKVDGIVFASKAEARRYTELKALEKSGVIEKLEIQPRFKLVVNGIKIATYIADYRYRVVKTGAVVIEDVKGVRTAVYRIKKKLVELLYGIEVIEVTYG